MSNRLKFRIFFSNKMVYPNRYDHIESIYECLKQQIMWDSAIDTDIKFNHIANELVFMQCTGLKDKNGKLIYEGDIVTYDDRDIYPYHTPILNAVIEMRKYQWCMVYYRKDIINADTREPAEQKTWLGFDDFITSRIEVIGNIYENADILKG